MRRKTLFILCLQLPLWLSAQTVDWKLVAQQEADTLQPIYNKSSVSTSWLNGATYFVYEQYGKSYLVDARTGHQEPLLKDQKHFVEQYKRLTGDTTKTHNIPRLYEITLKNNDSKRF